MLKITFIGAGSSVFAKNVLGDCLLTPALRECEVALYDIDPIRLKESEQMLTNINKNAGGFGTIKTYSERKVQRNSKPIETTKRIVLLWGNRLLLRG